MIVTNNPLVKSKLKLKQKIIYFDVSYFEILIKVRDFIHKGHELMTHPLSGSVKPNETPYKSIMLSDTKNKIDNGSISIIENSIETTQRLLKDSKTPQYSNSVLEDFQVIDYSLINNLFN